MEKLHTVLRAIRGETRPRREHLSVFREFIGHLDRVTKRQPAPQSPAQKPARPARRSGKR